MNNKQKIIIAITGASGAIYAQNILSKISKLSEFIEECAVMFSKNGKDVWEYEIGKLPDFNNNSIFRIVDNDNMFDAVASGSSYYNSMLIIPCSMGTIGRIASGISNELISRSADVMLKEKRNLIVVPRECPYSNIHIKNIQTLIDSGATIMPASPFFYHKPKTIDDLINPFIERIIEKLNLPSKPYIWK